MKKILAALLIACMVLSVSAVALAAYEPIITNESTGDDDYKNLEEALAEAKAGHTIKLLKDIKTSSTITITKGITLDGNGHTLKYTGSDRAIDMPPGADDAGADGDVITIKNLNVKCSASSCQRGINYNASGKLTLDNVTVKGDNITYAINMPGSADNCVVTINGGSYTGCIALNVWGEKSTITATNTEFTTVDNNSVEGYCTVMLNNNGEISANNTKIFLEGNTTVTVEGSHREDSSPSGNDTAEGKIINNTSNKIDINVNVAAVKFYGTDNSYGLTTLQGAVDTFIEHNASEINLLRDVEEDVEVPKSIVLNVNGFKNKGTIYLTDEDAAVIVTNKDDTVPAKDGLNVKSKVIGLAVVYQDDDGAYVLVPGYTITFNANGGRGTMDPETVVKNSKYTLPANKFTAPAGKQFSHWIIEGEEDVILGEKITVNEDITLVAIWKDIPTAKITFDPNGGTPNGGTSMDLIWIIIKGSNIQLPEEDYITAPAGMKFSAYLINGEKYKALDIVPVPGDMTVKVLWEDIAAAPVVTPAPTAAPAAPKTGDNTNIALWMALMAISAVALVGLRKKSKASK